MADERVKRKLTAILVADMVGYSRLIEADETGTVARQKVHRDELIDPSIANNNGRIVKVMGDGMLIEFASVVAAVQCAVEVQRGMVARNANVPKDRQIQYRVGINLGDVIIDGDDILGEGVNVAARLEGLAEPGGVCISASVFEQVKNKLALEFEPMGPQQVKNITEPVVAFRLLSRADSVPGAPKTTVKPGGARRWRRPAIAAALVIVIGAGGLAIWRPWGPPETPLSAVPDKPAIAVLPFANLSNDPSQEYFADGMTEDLITDLSKISGLFVIARNSVFTYKGKAVKIEQVAEELGVRFVLEGSVRRVGEEVRINTQLIDARTGGHLWAERYDGNLADIFALQDRVTAKIVDALALTLTPQDIRNVGEVGTTNAVAHDAFLQGQAFYHRNTPEDNAKAVAPFQRAIELDPTFGRAHTALAKVYLKAGIRGAVAWARPLQVHGRRAFFLARQHLARAGSEGGPDVHVARSLLARNKHQIAVALAEARQALAQGPNNLDALEALSEALIFAGKPAEGRAYAERAMQLNPTIPANALYLIGLSHFASGDLEEAVTHVERAIRHAPTNHQYAGILAAAYGELGQKKEAEMALSEYGRLNLLGIPAVAQAVSSYPLLDDRILQRLADGFEKAGARSGVWRGTGRYLKLNSETVLSGAQVKSLLFGRKIEGRSFWAGSFWSQVRNDNGEVSHAGYPTHPGMSGYDQGESWIENNRICDRWPDFDKELAWCALIFRNPDGSLEFRNEYFMVTDTGPYPFSPVD
jgi:TolB-like protein/class 3 adenylate cyclase/Flp pilus assembly protein TadD